MRERCAWRWSARRPPPPERVAGTMVLAVLLTASGAVLTACGAGGGGEAGGTDDARAESPVSSDVRAASDGGQPAAGARNGQEAGEPSGEADATPPAVPGSTRILVGGHPVTVEIADEEHERQRGLMYREALPEDQGMLFVYPTERRLSFWMRNTLIPLDVAFIDRTGRIVDIQQMEPQTDETHTSRAPAMYALELRKGWFADHEVGVGALVEF